MQHFQNYPPLEEATDIQTPTGGVIVPIAMLVTIITPNATGSIPTSIAIGNSIGTNMIIRAIPSNNIPPIKNITLITNKIKIGFLETENTN